MRKEYLSDDYLEWDTFGFNEYASFVQALWLELWSRGCRYLMRFTGPSPSAVHFVMSH